MGEREIRGGRERANTSKREQRDREREGGGVKRE
jgi:hypothetical protein